MIGLCFLKVWMFVPAAWQAALSLSAIPKTKLDLWR